MLKRTIRLIISNKLTFSINLLCLSVGIAAFVLLILWVQKESSYNKFLKDENTSQVVTNYLVNGTTTSVRATSWPIIKAIDKTIPEIETIGYTMGMEETTIATEEKKVKSAGRYANADFFKVIRQPFLSGSFATALNTPSSVVISSELAERLYGKDWREKIDNKTLLLNNQNQLKITGVFEKFPEHSTIQSDFFISYTPDSAEHIGNYNYEAYFRLNNNADRSIVISKINKQVAPLTKASLYLQPFKDIYLYSAFSNGVPDGGRITYVRLFTAAAIFILLMACINFMNLNIASSFRRTKELGIKKILGAEKKSLVKQLIGEAYVTVFISILIAFVTIYFTLNAINAYLAENLEFPLGSPVFWLFILGVFIVTGLLASLYPAFIMSSFNPLNIVREKKGIRIGGVGLLKLLFTLQFFISAVLIYITYSAHQQVQFLLTKDLGYNKQNLVCKKLSPEAIQKMDVIASELQSKSFLSNYTFGSSNLLSGGPVIGDVSWPGKLAHDSTRFGILFSDLNFVKTFKIPVTAGDFNKREGAEFAVAVNKKAAQLMGGEQNILNQVIDVWGEKGRVTAIVEDFNFNSLYSSIDPLIIGDYPAGAEYLFIRPIPGRESDAMAYMDELNKRYSPAQPESYYWIEDRINSLYKDEANMGRRSFLFSIICIVISVSGLFGLVNFAVARRMREMGIRKILGGNIFHIVGLVFKDFIKWIAIAAVIAVPVSVLFLNSWLEKFAYRIQLNFWSFVIPLLGMGLIILLIVLYYSRRLGKINPARILRED